MPLTSQCLYSRINRFRDELSSAVWTLGTMELEEREITLGKMLCTVVRHNMEYINMVYIKIYYCTIVYYLCCDVKHGFRSSQSTCVKYLLHWTIISTRITTGVICLEAGDKRVVICNKSQTALQKPPGNNKSQ